MSAGRRVTVKAEDLAQLALGSGAVVEHAVGSGQPFVALVEQDGLSDAGELTERFRTERCGGRRGVMTASVGDLPAAGAQVNRWTLIF